MNLNGKFRPKVFSDVIGQDVTIRILRRQLETESFKHSYLFSGNSGCGKTTVARIFANALNDNIGEPIEIDAASNNSVDDMRRLVSEANERAVAGEYKVFIIDECHVLSNQAWQALLKLLEDMPKYTVIILCTTEFNKVPETIKNRCQCFNFKKVSIDLISERLEEICQLEKIKYTSNGLLLISKLANGSVRQSITYLEQCHDYSDIINEENVIMCLGEFSYDVYVDLLKAVTEKSSKDIIRIIDDLDSNGTDLVQFIDKFIGFILDTYKLELLNTSEVTVIPKNYVNYIKELNDSLKDRGIDIDAYYCHIMVNLINIEHNIKDGNLTKETIEILLGGK